VVQAGTLDAVLSVLLLAAGLIAFVFLFFQERRTAEPMVPFQLWLNKIIAIGNIGNLFNGALLMCVVAFLPTYMQGVMGRSATAAGAIIGAQSISWSLGSIISGRLIPATSYRTTGVVGGFSLIAGTACLVVLDRGGGLVHLVLVALLIGLGMGLCNQTFLLAVQSNVGWSERGIATASILFARTIGQVIGASVGGAILNFGVAHLAAGADQALNRLLDPATRGTLDEKTTLSLASAIGASLHNVFVIAGLLAILTFAATLLIPARIQATH
jgi:fucose permease